MRIDFAGGWSDVPVFADRHGGMVVNAAIDLYVRVEVRPGGRVIQLHALDLGKHLVLKSPGAIVYDGLLDIHKAALNMLPITGGVEVLSNTGVPLGSGLGTSGALDVALIAALAACRGEHYDRAELAELGYLLETGELKLLGGRQNQYAAALGGFLALTFGAGEVTATPLGMSSEQARDLGRHMVLAYTGESHFSSHTHGRVWSAHEAGDPDVTDAVRAVRDLASPVVVALEAGDWLRLATLMDENWRHQQRLDPTMSTPATRAIEDAARAAGAWGLKATGAGAGGCLAILCPAERRTAVVEAVSAGGARLLDFRFDFEGVATWDEADDEDGADAGRDAVEVE